VSMSLRAGLGPALLEIHLPSPCVGQQRSCRQTEGYQLIVSSTFELSLRVVRVAQADTVLTAKGRLVHAGRRIALSEVLMEDGAGRLVAHGSSLCFVFPPQSLSALPPSLRSAREPAHATLDPYLQPVVGEIIPQDL